MPKRANGEGTWGKKKIKGVDYFFYRDVNGKYTYSKTKSGVTKKLKESVPTMTA